MAIPRCTSSVWREWTRAHDNRIKHSFLRSSEPASVASRTSLSHPCTSKQQSLAGEARRLKKIQSYQTKNYDAMTFGKKFYSYKTRIQRKVQKSAITLTWRRILLFMKLIKLDSKFFRILKSNWSKDGLIFEKANPIWEISTEISKQRQENSSKFPQSVRDSIHLKEMVSRQGNICGKRERIKERGNLQRWRLRRTMGSYRCRWRKNRRSQRTVRS